MSADPPPSAASPSGPGGTAGRIPWLRIIVWFACTRAAIWAIAGISLRFVPKGSFFGQPRGPIDWLMHWDSQWYLEIAHSGYDYDPTQVSSVSFLPLYPMLIRAVACVTRNADTAAYVVSHACCLAAAGLLWRLTRDVTRQDRTADHAVAFFLLGPVAVFFAAIYSESTFLLCTLGALIAARRQRWLPAGLCGAGAALTRSVGLLLVIPLAIEFWEHHRTTATWRSWRTWIGFACCGLPAAGTAAYIGFLTWRFGDPGAYFVSHHHAGQQVAMPWKAFSGPVFANFLPFYKAWFSAAAVAGVALTIGTIRFRLPWSFIGFAVATSALYLSIENLEGIPRFFSVIFPFYAVAGIVRTRSPALGIALLVLSTLLSVLSVTLFVNGYWFT